MSGSLTLKVRMIYIGILYYLCAHVSVAVLFHPLQSLPPLNVGVGAC